MICSRFSLSQFLIIRYYHLTESDTSVLYKSTSRSRHQTGKEHKQLRRNQFKTAYSSGKQRGQVFPRKGPTSCPEQSEQKGKDNEN